MSSFAFDVALMLGIDLTKGGGGGGGGGGGREKHLRACCECLRRCMVARQESSALLGCRKKVFENSRQLKCGFW